MDNRPIGVLDSGLGGLTVWRELYSRLSNESLFYFGDGENCPYGDKSQEQVLNYVIDAVDRLVANDIKMLVVACNAATACCIEYLREHYSIPIIGIEPAVKPAILNSKSGVVGILATSATLKSDLFHNTSSRYGGNTKILSAVGCGFVELVENNMENTTEAIEQIESIIKPMIDSGVDHIVLGCTHYPFLTNSIKSVIGDRDISLVNPASAIVNRVEQLLELHNLFASKNNRPEYQFFTASDDEYLVKLKNKAELSKL